MFLGLEKKSYKNSKKISSLIKSLKNKLIIVSIFFAFPATLFSQETVQEKLLEEQTESSEQSELYEIIQSLKENPIDLNSANLHMLEIIPGFTTGIRQAIINYRQKNGRFQSKTDLLNIPGMTTELYEVVRDLVFIKTARTTTLKRVQLNWRVRLSDRVDRPKGFRDGTYESSPQKIYQRLTFSVTKNISGGVLLEKDSGEKRLDDLRLFYAKMHLSEKLDFLLGNYHIETGQGLVLWGPYGFSKSANPIYPVKKRGRGVRGYSTVDENAAFTGGALSFQTGAVHILAFASKSKLDATPATNEIMTSLFPTGFHRNASEKSKKDRVTESVIGGRIRYSTLIGASIGVTYYTSSFDKTIDSPNLQRNHFSFRGHKNSVGGFDWQWPLRNGLFFGEAARSSSGGTAVIAGVQFDFDKVQLAILFRDYKKDFHNFHGFGFADRNGKTQNERGYYTGLRYRITPSTTVAGYFDLFSQHWRTFFNPLPGEGRDFLSEVEQKFGKKMTLALRYRENKELQSQTFRDSFGREKRELVSEHISRWRLQLDYRISKTLSLRNRVEYSRYSHTGLTQITAHKKAGGILL
ncbi:MAG: ComEA family DNA-binding protein, partial [bacterium]